MKQFIGTALIIMGVLGHPSALGEPANTATLAILFGMLFLVIPEGK